MLDAHVKNKIFLKFLFFIFLGMNQAGFAADKFEYKQDLVERLSYIPLDTGLPFHKYVLFSIPIENINQDDALFITSEFEVTNNTKINLMIASSIELCDTDVSTSGIIVDPNNGFNIDPTQHHGVPVKGRIYKVTAPFIKKYLNVIIWAASSAATPNDKLKIEPNYGHLDLMVIRHD